MRRVLTMASARSRVTTCAIAMVALAPAAFGQATPTKKAAAPAPNAQAPTTTVDRIRATGTLKLGYRADARPLSYLGEAGRPTGYSVELCETLAEALKNLMSLPNLKVQWVQVSVDTRFDAVQKGEVDVLCGADTATLERRQTVAFSIPIFPGGVGALVRSDSPKQLQNILLGRAREYTPTWRAVALNILREQTFTTVSGTTAAQWLEQRGQDLQVQSRTVGVSTYDEGVAAVLNRQASTFFAERPVLLDAARRHPSSDKLTVIDRQFTFEPLALAVRRGDEDIRL